MTIEEFNKIPFQFISHLAMEDEHTTTYASKDRRFWICQHVNYKDGEPKGRSYTHYRIDGNVYKTKKKLIEAIKNL